MVSDSQQDNSRLDVTASSDFLQDCQRFLQGEHYDAWHFLGAQPLSTRKGYRFTVWAPHALMVRLVGDFNNWDGDGWEMTRTEQGFWHKTLPELSVCERYKYEIFTSSEGRVMRADPYARCAELRPATASVTWQDHYKWNDGRWMSARARRKPYDKPMLMYEVHAGSWKRGRPQTRENHPEGDMDPDQEQYGVFYTYRQLAEELVPYVAEWGYTHIELMPIQEHPFDGSWGYQTTGYYAPTRRYGNPDDFKYFVDACHQAGIGVVMDWVPAHFPRDGHGLRNFDGNALYEYSNPKRGEHKQWGTLVFDYGNGGVQSFLISNALYWLGEFHLDGLRVDAVSSMLYLNYNRPDGEWEANQFGGHIHLEAMEFLKKLNMAVFDRHPQALMIAEEATSYPGITHPVYAGGLGFNYKWNMGWMNDTLRYIELDPVMRQGSHDAMSFSTMYAYSENYILSLSHDEVVHGKRSLLDKMSGDYWQKFANLRVYLLYMMTHPGKKLLFMGYEYGQFMEWRFYEALEFKMTAYDRHNKLWQYNKALNHFYLASNCLWEIDHQPEGFEWLDADDRSRSIFAFIRKGKRKKDWMIVVLNMTPVVREDYWVGVPLPGRYVEVWNTDLEDFGGSGVVNQPWLDSCAGQCHRQQQYVRMTLPPLGGVCLRLMQNEILDIGGGMSDEK